MRMVETAIHALQALMLVIGAQLEIVMEVVHA